MLYENTVGFTCSTFDLLHAGHVLMLEEAKKHCDYLICGLQTDPTIDRPDTKNKPIQSIVERYVQLSAIKYVDQIVVYSTEQDLIDILQMYPIDVRILGNEYRDNPFTGKEECEKLGIVIHYNRRDHKFSTTELRARIAQAAESKQTAKPQENVRLPPDNSWMNRPTSE